MVLLMLDPSILHFLNVITKFCYNGMQQMNQELVRMIKTSLLINDRPSSFRFPRGSGIGLEDKMDLNPIESW